MSNADLGPATTLKSSLHINMFLRPVTDYFYITVLLLFNKNKYSYRKLLIATVNLTDWIKALQWVCTIISWVNSFSLMHYKLNWHWKRLKQTPAVLLLTSSHLIGHHVEEVVVDPAAVHPLSGRHRELLFLGRQHPTFGHERPAQAASFSKCLQRWHPHILKEARTQRLMGFSAKWNKRKDAQSDSLFLRALLCWISGKSSPTRLSADETWELCCSQSSLTEESVVFSPISCVLWLCCRVRRCQKIGRGGGECPVPSLSPPVRLGRECVRGGGSGREMTKRRRGRERRRRSTGIMCQSHLSLSIPYSQHCTKSTAQWDWACLIQIWKIKQLSCVTSGSLTRSFLRDLGQVWEREAHIRNPNEFSWLHYDPEMLKQDALDGFLPLMGQQRYRYMCLMINRPMDLEGL